MERNKENQEAKKEKLKDEREEENRWQQSRAG